MPKPFPAHSIIPSTAIIAHCLPTFKSHSTASGNAFEKNLCIKSFAFSFGVMGLWFGGWFHGLGVYGLEKLIFTARIGYVFYLRPESVGAGQNILAGIPLRSHLNHLPRAVVGAGGQEQKEQYEAHGSIHYFK